MKLLGYQTWVPLAEAMTCKLEPTSRKCSSLSSPEILLIYVPLVHLHPNPMLSQQDRGKQGCNGVCCITILRSQFGAVNETSSNFLQTK